MELLAPAGDRAALEGAVRGGADAVYLGLQALNARRGAGNFDEEGLRAACDYCHERDVKVHVTVNTLVKDTEFGQLREVAGALARAGADAAIVQDLGAARALRQMLPGLALHASTQMAIHNRQGVAFLAENQFARAVLAREMTYGEIARCAGLGVALEAFGHGALCVACSGQCLFSSLVGGRSGNRGLCAQPCRLPYRLEGPLCRAAGDLLSPKDLMTLGELDALKQAGVASLKLEGRLKGADYVYRVTTLYRLALDGEHVDASLLRQVFNRGYTCGYGPGVDDRELMCEDGEKHVLPLSGEWPQPPRRAIGLSGELTVSAGAPISLTLTDGQICIQALGPAAEAAQKPCDPARLAAQIQKTGATPYAIETLTVNASAFASAAALNALRRDALDALGRARAAQRRGEGTILPLTTPDAPVRSHAKPLLCVQARDADLLERAREWGADEVIWSPGDVTPTGLERAPSGIFSLALPPTLDDRSLDTLNRWALSMGARIGATLLSNPAHLAMRWPGAVRCDAPMNAMNGRTADFLKMPYMPSLELTAAEIRALPGEKELWVYGRAPLMRLRHCPLNRCLSGGPHAACRRCDHTDDGLMRHRLIDRRGAIFPLSRLKTPSGCVAEVLNSVPMMLLRRAKQLPPCDRWRLVFTDEDAALSRAVVSCHRRALDGLEPDAADRARLEEMQTTTGHYFRGVE